MAFPWWIKPWLWPEYFLKWWRGVHEVNEAKAKADKARIEVEIAKAQLEQVQVQLTMDRAKLAEMDRAQKVALYLQQIRNLDAAAKAKHGSTVGLSSVAAAPGEDPELVQEAFRTFRTEEQSRSEKYSRAR